MNVPSTGSSQGSGGHSGPDRYTPAPTGFSPGGSTRSARRRSSSKTPAPQPPQGFSPSAPPPSTGGSSHYYTPMSGGFDRAPGSGRASDRTTLCDGGSLARHAPGGASGLVDQDVNRRHGGLRAEDG